MAAVTLMTGALVLSLFPRAPHAGTVAWPATHADTTVGRQQPTAEPGRTIEDADADGLPDAIEDSLAERFAPIVYHGERETSFPVSVEWWLERTHLGTTESTSWPNRGRRVVTGPLRQTQLLNQTAVIGEVAVSSSGTRSRGKRLSFFLEDLPQAARSRTVDPGLWVTYVHSYPNEMGGVTIQYWRAYAWNDARFAGLNVGHGGDWEAIAVHLDARLQPSRTAFLDHTGIVDGGASVQWEGTHPLVWSEEGGHSSNADSRQSRSGKWIRHPTWTDAIVTHWDGTPLGRSGGLRNVGEKTHPRNGQVFVQYSGLWGSPGGLFMTSGYWGPAFNETGARCADGAPAYSSYLRRRAASARCEPIFLKAWCDGMNEKPLNRTQECYAANETN
jgi:hypothetical protein